MSRIAGRSTRSGERARRRLGLPAALAILALAAVAAGCGDDGSTSATGNATDAAFINDMTDHHRGAVDMAELAREKADHAELERLADDIVAAQEAEISAMSTIREDVGEHGDAHMGLSDHAMGMDMDMTALERARPFDKAFIDAMVPHHEGAVAMAEELLEKGEHPDLRRMAAEMIDAQTEEIARMRRWRKAWYGSDEGSADVDGHGHGAGDHGSMDAGD